jgi:chemotaxis receptor (MCP) glutamine deamidase CheD
MTEKFQIFNSFHNYTDYIFVGWDDYKIGEKRDLIGTDSVATCLAITLYDSQRKKGILAHITGRDAPEELKPKNIIDTLLHELNGGNTDYKELEATLSGEGVVVCERQRSSPTVRAKLQNYGIPIIGEDLCRAPGRLVFLHCGTGRTEVYRI